MRASVSTDECDEADGATTVAVDAVFVHPSGWSSGRNVADAGGAFVGHAGGRRVLGAERSHVCRRELVMPHCALSPVRRASPDGHVLVGASCAMRATLAAGFARDRAAARVAVVGAAGSTGCLLAGLLRVVGIEATAVTASRASAADSLLEEVGFHRVTRDLPRDAGRGGARLDALVDLVPGGSPEARAWAEANGVAALAFGPRRDPERVPYDESELTVVDSWSETLRDPARARQSFEDVLDGLSSGVLRVPIREVVRAELDDVVNLFAGHRVVGAVVLRPRSDAEGNHP